MAAFFLLVAIPVAIVIVVISLLFREEAVRIARERTSEATARTAQSLDTEAMSFALFTSALMNDDVLLEHARRYTGAVDAETRYAAARGMETSVSWFFRITSRIGSVFLFFPDGTHFQYSNYPTNAVDFDAARELASDPGQPAGEVWCLDEISVLPGAVEKPPVLSMAVRPRASDTRRSSIASILVSFRIPLLDRLAAGVEGEAGTGYLVNRAGKVILSADREAVNQPFETVKKDFRGKSLVIESAMESVGWTFVETIPLRTFTRNVDVMMRYVYLAIALVTLLFVFYTQSFFSDIVNPLRSVMAQMGKVSDGDFSVRAREEGPAEFRALGAAFNVMVGRLDELTTQIVAEQKERTRVEIEALRFQLNPHFICNTLNAIGMMASIAKVDSIKRMTTALTRIMRETLQADDTLFAFEDELKNLESYVYIMKIRFGDSFDYQVEAEEGLARAGIPTMLLQPLVENAILHGLRGRSGGNIVVAAKRDGDFVRLEVRDDGAGMSAEKVEGLFEPPGGGAGVGGGSAGGSGSSGGSGGGSGFNRIGLYNVRRRVVLSYGPPCDVEVESFPGAGTIVRLLLPLQYLADAKVSAAGGEAAADGGSESGGDA
jgi:two-component system sensor histidine kinase YesM